MLRLRLVPRVQGRWSVLWASSLALVTALVLGGLVLLVLGVNPLRAYGAILHAAFFDGLFALGQTGTKATPLILTGLACAITFRAGLWNVGAEGQLLLGAWAATGAAGIWLSPEAPAWLMLPAMMIAAAIVGGLYGAVAGALRARFGTSEILSTLMLVYVATQWNNFWIYSRWSDRGFGMTPRFPDQACLPDLGRTFGIAGLRGSQLHLGIFIALLLAVGIWLLFTRTRLGQELRLQGSSPGTASYAGVPVGLRTVLVLALSGALAGLAGMFEVSGVVHRLQENFSPGYGFTGILIAWLARLHPGGIVLASFLFGGLLVGAKEVQPGGISTLLQGVLLITLIGFEFLVRYRVELVQRSRGVS